MLMRLRVGHPAILVKCARKGVPERMTGSCMMTKKEGKHTACVSDSNDEKEKDPEVQVKSLARGSAFVGYPERKGPKQSRHIEGNCETSLYSKQSILVPN